MPRFTLNRRWTFILALSVTLASATALWPSIGASDEVPLPNDTPIGGDVAGDPDRPLGGKGMRGMPSRGGMGIEQSTAGDGAVTLYRARMLRLRVVLLSLRGWYFHF